MKAKQGKLVRDRIPQIILESGRMPVTHRLGREEYLAELRAKLTEEVEEFLASGEAEELADIREVVDALSDLLYSREKVARLQERKRERNGAFRERIYLDGIAERGEGYP